MWKNIFSFIISNQLINYITNISILKKFHKISTYQNYAFLCHKLCLHRWSVKSTRILHANLYSLLIYRLGRLNLWPKQKALPLLTGHGPWPNPQHLMTRQQHNYIAKDFAPTALILVLEASGGTHQAASSSKITRHRLNNGTGAFFRK